VSDAANGLSTPVEAAPAPAPAPATGPLDGDLSPDRAVFDRGYVQSIRTEGQRYRAEAEAAQQQAARYNDVFGIYDAQDQEVWLNLARAWAVDPNQAAQMMQQIANGVLGEGQPVEPEPTPTAPAPVPEALTAEQVQRMIAEGFQSRDQTAAEQRAIDGVMNEVREHGFDPDTAEGFMVLWRANHETGGDIAKAAEMVKGYRQSIINDYVQGRSSGRVPLPGAANGAPAAAAPGEIKNLDDARRATDAWLRERRGA
jgi:hypothetical protein